MGIDTTPANALPPPQVAPQAPSHAEITQPDQNAPAKDPAQPPSHSEKTSPSSFAQSGLVIAAAASPTENTAHSVSSSSPAERTLKPYGIAMLPEKLAETGPQLPKLDQNK